jgi:phenazine biosynthesis protein phzE
LGTTVTDLRTLLGSAGPAFALVHRPVSGRADRVGVYLGDPRPVGTTAALALPPGDRTGLVVLLPYRQISERGLVCVDDGAPLMVIRVREHADLPMADVLRDLPEGAADLAPGGFDMSDDAYAAAVRRVIATNIGRGDGSNFVLRRTYRSRIRRDPLTSALRAFRHLLVAERGAYWTFLLHCDGRTLVGATPECHLRVERDVASMNPISGTYRYPPGGPDAAGLRRFLADRKEREELLMVVDEELKMMARVCDDPRVRGPYLRPMSRLAHTGYVIDGRPRADLPDMLRWTTPAPTVTGSPIASACRIIADHEGTGRGYYGGVLALVGRRDGRPAMDSALVIRTADIHADGRAEVAVGATLVRHSDAVAEAMETRVKAAALLAAFASSGEPDPAVRPEIETARTRRALARHTAGLSLFWRGLDRLRPERVPTLTGRRLLVVDGGDDFTTMLSHLVVALGLSVRTGRPDDVPTATDDVVVLGPGPGDPRDLDDPRIADHHAAARSLLAKRRPFLAVCLGHQVLAIQLGLPVGPLARPVQGVQRRVPWHGKLERVGFYNTFAASSVGPLIRGPAEGDTVRVWKDRSTHIVHGLDGGWFQSVQFHVESILTENGPRILRDMLVSVLATGDSTDHGSTGRAIDRLPVVNSGPASG